MKAKEVPLINPSALFIATRGLKISTDPDLADTKVPDYEEIKRKLRNCQDEVYKLQAANSDLTQVNKRWHKYNSDMQIFIDRLQCTIRDQQEQINSIGEDHTFTYKREESSNECDKQKCRRLKDEVIKLREEVEHLKFQVRAHKDDWEAEKLEKQEALNERDALQSRLNDVLRDICNLNRSTNDESLRRSQACPCCNHWEGHNLDYTVNPSGYNHAVISSPMVRHRRQHQNRFIFTDENIECDSASLHASKEGTCHNIKEAEEKNYSRKLSTSDIISTTGAAGGIAGSSAISSSSSLLSDDKALEDTACSLLPPREESYSTSSTIPSTSITQSRANSPITHHRQQTTTAGATTVAMGIKTGNGATLTSYVRLPVVKSHSAPEGGSLAGPSGNVRLNSISLSLVPGTSSNLAATSTVMQSQHLLPPPRSLPSLVHDLSDDEIECPRCHEVFTSGRHLDFIDHFEDCQRGRD